MMSSLSLIPMTTALYLTTAGGLLFGVSLAANRLRWFRRAPAPLRADRLLCALLCPLAVATIFTALVAATLVEDLVAFHHLPHLCLDRTLASAVGKMGIFCLETFALLATGVVGFQLFQVTRLFHRYRRLDRLGIPALSEKAATAAAHVRERLHCPGLEVREADLPRATAFLVGAVQPRCVVARSLVDRLSPAELEAVIAHETAHLQRRDHLAKLLVFTCRRLFGFLHPVRALLGAWEEAAELAADDLAVERTGFRLELAGALLAAARQTPPGVTALLSGPAELLALRVERLLLPPTTVADLTRQRHIHFTLAITTAVVIAVVMAASPLLPSLHCLVGNLVSGHLACPR